MTKHEFLRLARLYPVAAAMKSPDDMQAALNSNALLLFMLKGDVFQLAPFVSQVHQRGKGIVVHIDLVSGIGKDRAGIQYLRQIGIDGIITSRSQLVSAGKAEGMVTIQRLLLVDDSSLEIGVRTIARAVPDIVEVLPGVIFPEIAAVLNGYSPAHLSPVASSTMPIRLPISARLALFSVVVVRMNSGILNSYGASVFDCSAPAVLRTVLYVAVDVG